LLFLLRRNVETKTQSECKTHFNDFSHKSLSADDRLIKLVRANPAIYDVSHPHYRRNPVRVDIWDRIALRRYPLQLVEDLLYSENHMILVQFRAQTPKNQLLTPLFREISFWLPLLGDIKLNSWSTFVLT